MGYKLKASKDELYKKGFHYNKLLSDNQSEFYSLRFPVLKYKNISTLECEITVEMQTGKLLINVYKAGTNDNYIPFYDHEYGRYPILNGINDNITKQLKKLGAKSKNKNARNVDDKI